MSFNVHCFITKREINQVRNYPFSFGRKMLEALQEGTQI